MSEVALGLRANWRQFTLLVVVNAFVGAMVGLERTLVPLIGEADFGLLSRIGILSFIATFGLAKALTNLFAGRLADRIGRKRILVLGWLVGLPVPLLIIGAPAWDWIVFANVLLGINQGLCWSMTVVMKVDLVGPKQRGLALGLNESAGYFAVALSALVSGYLAAQYGLRPVPFYVGLLVASLGLLSSVFLVRETQSHAAHEAGMSVPATAAPRFSQIFMLTSWKHRALFAASQAGLVNNLNDGVVWGLVPLLLAGAHLPLEQIGLIVAAYPLVWSLGQILVGALSDRCGRKWLIATGMWVQASGIALLALGTQFGVWLSGAILLGLGTALVYPTLLAVVSDVARPEWRASAVGVYRLWRDLGYVVGALLAGWLADLLGISVTISIIGAVTLGSGLLVALVMTETLPQRVQQSLAASQRA
jgi:MFS family permease